MKGVGLLGGAGEGGSVKVGTSVGATVDVPGHASSQFLTLRTWECSTATIVPTVERNSTNAIVAVGDAVLKPTRRIRLRTTLLMTGPGRRIAHILSPCMAALIVIDRHAIYEATARRDKVASASLTFTFTILGPVCVTETSISGSGRASGVDAGTSVSVAPVAACAFTEGTAASCVMLSAWSHPVADEL
jgi:hypothetical protein